MTCFFCTIPGISPEIEPGITKGHMFVCFLTPLDLQRSHVLRHFVCRSLRTIRSSGVCLRGTTSDNVIVLEAVDHFIFIYRMSWLATSLIWIVLDLFGIITASRIYDLSLLSWTLQSGQGNVSIAASIPSVVHMDLFKAGIIQEPVYGTKQLQGRNLRHMVPEL